MTRELYSIKGHAEDEVKKASSLKAVQDLKVKYLGKKGIFTEKIKSLKSIPQEERPEYGRILNEIKNHIEALLKTEESQFKSSEMEKVLQTQSIDVTIPGSHVPIGRLHPTTKVLNEIIDIFTS
ncbi:MAG: phenylalanyl-tRNA synthetase, alpha subunit, partial [Nitrospirae bacterium]|nr:phenylalanyl-tRNA synthetase, alpha subunit [Nitrospirota bacterium]